jgi:hypothetical protein
MPARALPAFYNFSVTLIVAALRGISPVTCIAPAGDMSSDATSDERATN